MDIFNHLENFYLRVRYLLFKNILPKKDFSDRTLQFKDNFYSLSNFSVVDKQFYNNNPVWLSKDTVHITNDGLSISCYKDVRTHVSWQGTRDCTHTSGMVTTMNSFLIKNGVWVINAKPCESWCAIGLLKKDRIVDEYNVQQITPEIDIMEVLGGKHNIKHSVNYGYSNKYCMSGGGYLRCDNKFHEYAVEMLYNGYKFYIDGILTAKLISDDPEFVTDYPNYLLLNNASDRYTTKNTEFIVKSVKFYQ